MRPIILVTTWALAMAAIAAPAARAQEDLPDGVGPDDEDAFELADAGPLMHHGMDGPAMGGGWGFPGRRGMHGPHGPGFGMRLEAIRELDLTDAQRARLADIREQHLRTAIPLQAELRLAHLELGKLLRGDKPEVGAVDRQIDRIAELRGTLMKNHVTGMLESRAVLTSAQQKKLQDLRRQRPPRGEVRHSR
jgi:Spy/CpxP family protein refolding chaperone